MWCRDYRGQVCGQRLLSINKPQRLGTRLGQSTRPWNQVEIKFGKNRLAARKRFRHQCKDIISHCYFYISLRVFSSTWFLTRLHRSGPWAYTFSTGRISLKSILYIDVITSPAGSNVVTVVTRSHCVTRCLTLLRGGAGGTGRGGARRTKVDWPFVVTFCPLPPPTATYDRLTTKEGLLNNSNKDGVCSHIQELQKSNIKKLLPVWLLGGNIFLVWLGYDH